MDAGEADVRFGAETKDLESGTKRVSGQIKELSEQINGYAEGIKNALTFGIVGDGIKEIVQSTYEWASAMAELGDQTERMGHMLGATADEVQQFRYLAAASGQSVEGLSLGMERLGYNAERAEAGSKTEADAFSRLGVSLKDAGGHTKDFQTLMEDVSDSFSKHSDGVEKDALAIQIFGRAGVQMIPILDQGSAKLKEMEARSDSLTGPLAEVTAAQVEMHHTLTDLGAATTGFAGELFREFEPALNGVFSQVVDLISGFREWMKDSYDTAGAMRVIAFAADVVAAAIMTLIQLFRDLWDVASAVLNTLGDGLTGIGIEMEDVFERNWSKLAADSAHTADLIKTDWSKAWADASSSSKSYAENIKKMFDATINPPKEIRVGGDAGPLPAFGAPADTSKLNDAMQKLKATVKEVQSTFQTFFSSVISGFDKAATGLITKSMTWQEAMYNVIDGVWSSLVKFGEDWVAKWLANEATILVAHQTAAAEKIATDQAAQDQGSVNMIMNAIKSIFASSKQTAAGVTANLAPTIGPLAIPAGLAAGASVAGLASFDVGSYNIPDDMVANVHQGEAIVPAAGGMADAFRGLTDAISGGGSVGGGDVHFHAGAFLDKGGLARIVTEYWNKNPSARPLGA